MRLSRPCYDKPWRCPGWAGGGMKYAKVDHCDNGRMLGWRGDLRWPHLRFHRCDTCNVVTWPSALRWLSPFFLMDEVRRRIEARRGDVR